MLSEKYSVKKKNQNNSCLKLEGHRFCDSYWMPFLSHDQDEKLHVTYNPRYYPIYLHLKIPFDKHTYVKQKLVNYSDKKLIYFGIRKYWKCILKY